MIDYVDINITIPDNIAIAQTFSVDYVDINIVIAQTFYADINITIPDNIAIAQTFSVDYVYLAKFVFLDKLAIRVGVGFTNTLTATIYPSNTTNKNIIWSSSDELVATVLDGVVTGVAEGNCIITVTTEDGGFTDNCSVTAGVVNGEYYNTDYNGDYNLTDIFGIQVILF